MFLSLLLPPPKIFEEGPAKELAKGGREEICEMPRTRGEEQVENRETISECESGKAADGSGMVSSSTKQEDEVHQRQEAVFPERHWYTDDTGKGCRKREPGLKRVGVESEGMPARQI